tara:strand:+ start:9101 stop:9889 length:789 start_codon:yes stop_codon:yes gene_type:complete
MTTKKAGSGEPTYESVWKTLSKIDCSDKAESKNGLTYLSWAWAWGILMENYPQATYDFLNEEWDREDRCTVWCKVRIGELERLMWLPVMDYKNKAIVSPDTRAVSDTRMRCLTKCLAMYGLGHYIYAGEDVPAQTEPVPEEKPPPKKTAAKKAPAKKADNIVQMPQVKTLDDLDDAQSYIDEIVEVGSFGDQGECENFVNFFIGFLDTFWSTSKKDLKDGYVRNTGVFDLVKEYSTTGQYEILSAHMSALKQAINNQESSNE